MLGGVKMDFNNKFDEVDEELKDLKGHLKEIRILDCEL